MRPFGVTVVIPSLPQRRENGMLDRAYRSVASQDCAKWIISGVQVEGVLPGESAAVVRDRGLRRVETAFTAFLDDDDRLRPQHIRRCLAHLIDTGADLVYPWFDVEGGTDPFPEFFGQPWDNEHPHQTTVTFLARTDALLACGGFLDGEEAGVDPLNNRIGEEYRLVLRMVAAGYKIVHLPERSWIWTHWSHPNGITGNTSGLPERVWP